MSVLVKLSKLHYRAIACIIVFVLLFGLNNNQNDDLKTLKKNIGKQVVFPEATKLKMLNGCFVKNDNCYKVIVNVTDQGCTRCKLSFSKWEQFMKQLESLEGANIQLYFLIAESQINVVKRSLIQDNVNFNIIVDENNKISSKNNLPNDERYSVLLLDGQNRILLIGNPLYSSKLKNMYTKIISGFYKDIYIG